MKKKIIICLVILILASCIFSLHNYSTMYKSTNSKYTRSWLKENELFPKDNVRYYMIDNPAWSEDTQTTNAFAICFSFYGEDYEIEYDIAGTKFGYYKIANMLYGFLMPQDNKKEIYTITGSESEFDSNSVLVMDKTLLNKIITPDYTKCEIKYMGEIEGSDVVVLASKEYDMALYINPSTGKCERFEYFMLEDKESFKCFITDCNRIEIPEDATISKQTYTAKEFASNITNLATGAIYMLQTNQNVESQE